MTTGGTGEEANEEIAADRDKVIHVNNASVIFS